jgi:hypothetical protein
MKKLIGAFLVIYLYYPCCLLAQDHSSVAMPHILVYKAKKQYRSLVPVQLSGDGKTVVSYPDPVDVKTGSGYPLPVLLHKGYWLDKFGVGLNTAFIKMTYEQYSKLKTVPTPDELFNMIVDKAPVTELCDCGSRQDRKYTVKYLNGLIDGRRLRKECKVIR